MIILKSLIFIKLKGMRFVRLESWFYKIRGYLDRFGLVKLVVGNLGLIFSIVDYVEKGPTYYDFMSFFSDYSIIDYNVM